jgi:hypothetical protein
MRKPKLLAKTPSAAEGTGLYRTLILVEVLSDTPVADWDLVDVAREMTDGDLSGVTEVVDSREISRRSMAAALRRQGSDPEFLLGE